ncbi:uncharacterized protein LOC106882793 [Octopus bimaculoides]|nr:uncharacterized protein LOC106882793 [Octopus bimaculoides]|eukprot:XP_014789061.1 PREDICTED: uncharacterized protein LOC106882793 [Octopus bimaculoides]
MSLPFIITSSLAEKNKDETRRMNEVLFLELETLQREYKRSRQVVEQLTKDYEESKDLDPVRRYEKLKVMVKRTIMHFKVNSEEQIKEAAAAAACQGTQAEALKRRGEKNTKMTRQEMIEENTLYSEQIKNYRRKVSILSDLIQQLEDSYEESKRYAMMQRYRLLKMMIKSVIYDKLI